MRQFWTFSKIFILFFYFICAELSGQIPANDTLIWTALPDTNRFEVKVSIKGDYPGENLFFGLYSRYGHYFIQTPKMERNIESGFYLASNVWTQNAYDLVEVFILSVEPSVLKMKNKYDSELELLRVGKIIKKFRVDLSGGRLNLFSEKAVDPRLKKKLRTLEFDTPFQPLAITIDQLCAALKESDLRAEKELISQLVLVAADDIIDKYNSVFISDYAFICRHKEYKSLLKILCDAVTSGYDPKVQEKSWELVQLIKLYSITRIKSIEALLGKDVSGDLKKRIQLYSDNFGDNKYFYYNSSWNNKLINDLTNKKFDFRKSPLVLVDNLKQNLKPNELFVQYFMMDDTLKAFFVSSSTFTQKNVCSRKKIDSIVDLENKKWSITDSSQINRQYNNPELSIFWEPVDEIIKSCPNRINRVYIGPDYSLNYINFSAILYYDNVKPGIKYRLISKYEIDYCSGFDLGSDIKQKIDTAVMIGGIDYKYPSVKGLPHNSTKEVITLFPLMNAKAEFVAIDSLLKKNNICNKSLSGAVHENNFRNHIFHQVQAADFFYFSGHSLSINVINNPEETISSAFALSNINFLKKQKNNIYQFTIVR